MKFLKITILIAVVSLFTACSYTDENGATISRGHIFAQADCTTSTNI